ncbi:Ger(x)C family spore germination protein [Paenibacillus flagellatus]|uniref:Ger(X)C family spore germination protein n=1 Tax=Paenibacillus flagellatus TaxID=2211139 RepID=A0A2V5K699_9BACL|nr:Ger(x)C family spore germination protein [Paenibacillus flagellatus]PYI54929.1 Ger(x)C family spore germination protein [Paenibacillus flagellatus]
MQTVKRWVRLAAALATIVAATAGCYDRTELEDITIALMMGIDLDEHDEPIVYMSSPVFSKEAKRKTEEFGVKSTTIRQARGRFDAMVTALTKGGKIQEVLIGKRVLQHPDWFQMLDVMYRDAKMTVNARVIAVDGKVSDIIGYYPENKPRLSLHLVKLTDTASRRNITVKTTLQEFHRQMHDKGMTASVTEMVKRREIEVKGTALLDDRGRYVTSLGIQESTLLQLLRRGLQHEMSLTLPIPVDTPNERLMKNRVSFFVKKGKVRVRTSVREGRFVFDIRLDMNVAVSERMFRFEIKKNAKSLETMVRDELGKQFASLVRKLQTNRVDPIGLGLYARAYQYREWKKVEDRWSETFAEADIRVTPVVSIVGDGIME